MDIVIIYFIALVGCTLLDQSIYEFMEKKDIGKIYNGIRALILITFLLFLTFKEVNLEDNILFYAIAVGCTNGLISYLVNKYKNRKKLNNNEP